jgi:thymidylate synthase (FAD)
MRKIDVLDKGYVRLVDVMGSDLTVVNAARVSFDKESQKLSDKDKRLINYLAQHGHTSPFRHASLQFEVYAPLMVARQWWKYVVGSDHTMDAWNESSRRYITEDAAFYVPNEDEWRKAPDNSKQGSGDNIVGVTGQFLTKELLRHIEHSENLYEEAMKLGVAAEQARLFLPAYGMYVRWYWTASLQGVAHLINQRVAKDAQKEFQEYARAVLDLSKEDFPQSIAALTNM